MAPESNAERCATIQVPVSKQPDESTKKNDHVDVHCQRSAEFTFQACSICQALAELEVQISGFQAISQDLSERSIQLKISRNMSHDRLTVRLPVELVSRIFAFIDESNDHSLHYHIYSRKPSPTYVCTPAFLSKISSKWRKIALATPQLWTNVLLNLYKHSIYLDITKEWLLRSRSLPLNLRVYVGSRFYGLPSLLDPIIDVLRLHSTRWNHLDFRAVERDVVYKLFHKLESTPSSDFFDLQIQGFFPDSEEEPMFLHTPLRPRHFTGRVISSKSLNLADLIPLKWDNLTHLEISGVHIHIVLHIVQQSPKLQSWISRDVEGHNTLVYRDVTPCPAPANPIIHHSLNHLELCFFGRDVSVFNHLTMPSLQHLRCRLYSRGSSPDENDTAFDCLMEFMERSNLRPGFLPTFQLEYGPFLEPTFHRCKFFDLAAVTHLHIDIEHTYTLSAFQLRISDITVFPHLRVLRFCALDGLDEITWDIFCDITIELNRDIKENGATLESEVYSYPASDTDQKSQGLHRFGRPLESVTFTQGQRSRLQIKRETILRLREVQKVGPIKLEVEVIVGYKENKDILAEGLIFNADPFNAKEEGGCIIFKPYITG